MHIFPKKKPDNLIEYQGVKVYPLETALAGSVPTSFQKHPVSMQVALKNADLDKVVEALLLSRNIASAGRIIGAYGSLGMRVESKKLESIMSAAFENIKSDNTWFSSTTTHKITYAIRPYPVTNQPAPVFVQGDVNKVFDAVFIPDTDITNMATFRSHVRSMIKDAMFAEPSIKLWNRQFNFYINPLRGTSTDYDRIAIDGRHVLPTNIANLSFAEVKVLMHQNNLRDYAFGGVFSTEQQNRGTMMHEGGHGFFGLADEYGGGSHWQAADYPNNWSTLAGAQTDAPNRHKTVADAKQMGTSGWYRVCDTTCQMDNTGLTRSNYDKPCTDRVIFAINENANTP